MNNIDRRNKLEEQPFTYNITKKKTVRIFYFGKPVVILKENKAEQLIERMEEVDFDEFDVQLLLAKATGNFKRGNEKNSRRKWK
ncbi:hypothetical protein CW666_10880 [Macrococcoides caseolyticum]|uniref:hypothetical protein n=1 Tax=Macrococcoides caseolyticum TaxID=69966 RepID=UPI000C33DAE9|nr:hypothetical protein [Macrococcus caseolyticus]PKE43066.1 hypothetical protein CW666_10880 [Macrococcus caseolyticus]